MGESAAGCAVLRITHRVGVTEERGGCEGVRRVVRSTPPGIRWELHKLLQQKNH